MEETTYSISEFASELRGALRARMPAAWLTGEVQRVRRSGRGHLYFELVEKGSGDDIVAKLEAVIWRSDLEQVERELGRNEQALTEGIEIRCRGQVDFYPPFGRLQLVVRRVDPEFTLGLLSRRRRETLRALEKSGLLDTNKALPLSEVPLRVGLITSRESAAFHDFTTSLAESDYGFCVHFLHSAVQGRDSEGELLRAVRRAGSLELDCLVLVRGGGSRTDLAVFDSRRLAEGLARFQVPVITGLGHEIDESMADLVAHSRTKTPTQAAELLVARVRQSDLGVAALRERLVSAAREPLTASHRAVDRLGRELSLARFRLSAGIVRLRFLADRLGSRAAARLSAASQRSAAHGAQVRALGSVRVRQAGARIERFAPELGRQAGGRLRARTAHLAAIERLCRQLSPERTLRRGFSVTRLESGAVVRSAKQVAAGCRLETQLVDGIINSEVESR